jgi:hypothetical protein
MTLKPPIDDMSFTMYVSNGDGTWLDINDGTKYKVSADSIGSNAVTWRKTEVTSPYVEGKFLVHAVKDMVSNGLTVWVTGYPYNNHASGQNQLQTNIDDLITPFEQISYQIKYTMGNMQIVWDCQTADHSVEMSREYVHAMMVPVKFTVPRFPTATRSAI